MKTMKLSVEQLGVLNHCISVRVGQCEDNKQLYDAGGDDYWTECYDEAYELLDLFKHVGEVTIRLVD